MIGASINEIVFDITMRNGGAREKEIFYEPHKICRTETWNDEHKVIKVVSDFIETDGSQVSYDIDLVTGRICG